MAESQGGEGREAVLTMTTADCLASAPFTFCERRLSPNIPIQYPRVAVFLVAIHTVVAPTVYPNLS